eukprot:TRINITY_DN67734_c0_g1_i1.p1 TRINITY_DN67734_c0_g1~~TRINITY_DN67734_c0_g1_i1.p1  ORF type:complete len:776 (-),score=136.44 TRINITY_DN67734_c0_g1_i1:106-2433(-)
MDHEAECLHLSFPSGPDHVLGRSVLPGLPTKEISSTCHASTTNAEGIGKVKERVNLDDFIRVPAVPGVCCEDTLPVVEPHLPPVDRLEDAVPLERMACEWPLAQDAFSSSEPALLPPVERFQEVVPCPSVGCSRDWSVPLERMACVWPLGQELSCKDTQDTAGQDCPSKSLQGECTDMDGGQVAERIRGLQKHIRKEMERGHEAIVRSVEDLVESHLSALGSGHVYNWPKSKQRKERKTEALHVPEKCAVHVSERSAVSTYTAAPLSAASRYTAAPRSAVSTYSAADPPISKKAKSTYSVSTKLSTKKVVDGDTPLCDTVSDDSQIRDEIHKAKENLSKSTHMPESHQVIFGNIYGSSMRSIRHYEEDVPLWEDDPFFKKLARHPVFDCFSCILIVVGTVHSGVDTEFRARHWNTKNVIHEWIFMGTLFGFTIELFIRVLAYRTEFFTMPDDRAWNIFDLIMVVCGFADLFASKLSHSIRVVKVLRMVRLVRCLRLGRAVRFTLTFRQILYSLKSSVSTLAWVIAMVFLILYCLAVAFTEGATDILQQASRGAPVESTSVHAVALKEIQEYYSSLFASLYTLYKAMAGGQSWGEVLDPLRELSPFYASVFVAYITITFFGVLNVVAAIFVDSALQSQQHYKDLLIQDKQSKKALYSDHLRTVFESIDADGSGRVTGAEMEYFLGDSDLRMYLESIDIFPNDARALFRLLDCDASGEVSIEEFLEGCLRLKGEAKSFDIHILTHNVLILVSKVDELSEAMQTGGFQAKYSDDESSS